MKNFKTKIRKQLADRFTLSSMEDKLLNHLNGDLDVVLDIGASKGYFIKQLRSLKPVGQVIFCEANENVFSDLEEMKKPNDKIVPAIVSDKVGQEKFYIFELETTSSVFRFDESMNDLSKLNLEPKEERLVNAITVDSLMKDQGIQKVDLMKIDVQGAEMKVLNGSLDSLKLIRNIWIEVSFRKVYKDSPVFSDIYSFLTSKGFIFKSFSPVFLSPQGEILQADVLFMNTVHNG